jgi:hypothetical protein
MKRVALILTLFLGLIVACSPAAATRIAELTTPTAVPHSPGVADILRHPPAPGIAFEVDAYYSGASHYPMPGPPPLPDRIACPMRWNAALTDRPILSQLQILNGTRGNAPPDDAPWLIAATEESKQLGVYSIPSLPYHARLRGHLGDPAFAQCDSAARIFFVEKAVKVYQQDPPAEANAPFKPPADYASWPRFHDARFGYSLPYPSTWRVERPDEVTLRLTAPQWDKYPVVVRVHAGETHWDQYQPAALPTLMQGANTGFGVFQQDWVFSGNIETQPLDGYEIDRDISRAEPEVTVLLSGGGYTYELTLRYPTGFDAPQPLLTAYTAIVEGFHLDVAPGPSPTPPIKQTLGKGPFLTREEALARARANNSPGAELLDAQLVPEATARAGEVSSPCGSFEGHPDGVWVLKVRGTFEGMTRTMKLLLDATTGKQLCGEEITPPLPPDHPGVTSTPVPPQTPTPAPSPTRVLARSE